MTHGGSEGEGEEGGGRGGEGTGEGGSFRKGHLSAARQGLEEGREESQQRVVVASCSSRGVWEG